MIATILMVAALIAPGSIQLDVPILEQAPERCGQAALGMVLQYYGAGPAQQAEAERAYDPVLRGSLITDLAAAARRAGFDATIATMTPDSLVALLGEGVPPIVLYQSGAGPLTVRHFGVVTGWDPTRDAFTLNEGSARSRTLRLAEIAKRWRTAGSQALVIRRRTP
jgi:ABC-type bacteriocin/lantibiotic exporter with double-glycine peptidase domain